MKKCGRSLMPSFLAFALAACANGAPPRGFTGSAGATGGGAAGSNGGGNAGTSTGGAGSSSPGIGGTGGGSGTGGTVNGTAGIGVGGGGGGGNGGVAGSTPDAGAGGVGMTSAPGLKQGPFKIIVLSTTDEFRHDSIPNGLQMLIDLGMASAPERAPGKIPGLAADTTWTVDHIGDGSTWNGPACPPSCGAGSVKEADEFGAKITADNLNLKNYEMLYSDSPTGKVFTNQPNGMGPAKKQIFVDFWNAGGSWAGQHSATDFENSNAWTWFQDNINGGWFTTHDNDGTPGTINVQSQYADSPILKGIPNPWNVGDEWYVMNRDIDAVAGFKVLAKVTVSNSMLSTAPRPAIWSNENTNNMGGRAFYTIRGHNKTVFAEPAFRQLMLQGILWAVHRLPGGN
jgi:Trehalose utilisation